MEYNIDNIVIKNTYPNGEKILGSQEFKIRITFTGDLYINEKFYRQCIFTSNQAALAIESFLNGEPADE